MSIGSDMNEEQYWDCDYCNERYPVDYTPRKLEEIDGEVAWLCGSCYIDAEQPTMNLGQIVEVLDDTPNQRSRTM
jgi:hypothetical protein